MLALGLHALLFGLALAGLVAILRWWRSAVDREDEVLRLLSMVSDESVMGEDEAELDTGFYGGGGESFSAVEAPVPFLCAVCCCATTMRCSQCKSVRYCSGKCQIVHWRQGHKDECHRYRLQFEMRSELSGQCATSSDEERIETVSDSLDRLENPLSGRFDQDSIDGTANVKQVRESSSSDSAKLSEDYESNTSKSKKMKPRDTDEIMKSDLQYNKSKMGKPENGLPATNLHRKKSTRAAHLAEKSTKDTMKLNTLLNNDGDHSSPLVASSLKSAIKVDDYHHNGLKTSMRKVVQQFRSSVQSKSDTSIPGNEMAGKHKLIFPYELFVNLYNHEMTIASPFGLTNCGNSCYANAVLQCLAFTRPFTAYLFQGLHSKFCKSNEWCFICEFEYLIYKAREGTSPLSPIRILSKIPKIGSHLSHGKEEDAHEFLRYAVDTMQSIFLNNAGAKGPLAEESTLVGMTFGGYLLSKIKCMKCLGKSEQCERMMDLTVEIDGEIDTLDKALAQFTATETLDRDNKYRCSRCKSYEKARKKLTVLEAPNILTIVLKRFKSGNFEKLNKPVRFRETLDMAPYMSKRSDKPPLYTLYAVVVHLDIMDAAFSGHYVCYVKNCHGSWFRIDDSAVKPVESKRVLSEGAYMLLYSRRSPRPPAMLGAHAAKSKKRNLEAIPTASGNSKSKSNPTIPTSDFPTAHQNLGPDPDDWRRFRGLDSSSQSSSLFSSSDASSSSTVSSGGANDLSDYLFGDATTGFYTQDVGASCSEYQRRPPSRDPEREGVKQRRKSSSQLDYRDLRTNHFGRISTQTF